MVSRIHISWATLADPSLAEEIANLCREAQALKEIRQSLGSSEFARKVFEKVFQEDIEQIGRAHV